MNRIGSGIKNMATLGLLALTLTQCESPEHKIIGEIQKAVEDAKADPNTTDQDVCRLVWQTHQQANFLLEDSQKKWKKVYNPMYHQSKRSKGPTKNPPNTLSTFTIPKFFYEDPQNSASWMYCSKEETYIPAKAKGATCSGVEDENYSAEIEMTAVDSRVILHSSYNLGFLKKNTGVITTSELNTTSHTFDVTITPTSEPYAAFEDIVALGQTLTATCDEAFTKHMVSTRKKLQELERISNR